MLSTTAHAFRYVDHSLVQLAGEIGFVSLGLEKNFSRYGLGLLYGIVPAEISGGRLIETVALRQTYRFYDWKRLSLFGGLNVFHVLGLDYQSSRFKDAPESYYPIGSIRALFNLGLNVQIDKSDTRSMYLEAGINDIWLVNYLSNGNEINPTDHVSLALGFKHRF